jgi:hypothetical protein
MTETAYAMYVGIDWGTASHQVAVLDAQRVPLGERAVAHDGRCVPDLHRVVDATRGRGASPRRCRAGGAARRRGRHAARTWLPRLRPQPQAARPLPRSPKTIVGMLSYWPPPGDRPAGLPTARARVRYDAHSRHHYQRFRRQIALSGDRAQARAARRQVRDRRADSGSGIIVRRFEPTRSNPWHHAPSRYAVFYPFRRGRHRDRRRDGAPARPGDILIAEDLTGQGHATREVGPEPRVSIFVPLQASKS